MAVSGKRRYRFEIASRDVIRIDPMSSHLRRLVETCREVVTRGSERGPTSERAYYAHCLLAKATMHGKSIVTLCDSSLAAGELPDVGAICVLARCIIEARNVAAYLLESNISKNEAHFRLRLLGLNQAVDLTRVNRGLQTSRSDFWSEHSATFCREALEGNAAFCALDADHRKSLLRGRTPFQHTRYQGKRPLSAMQESAVYNLLSHSAHSFGLGLAPFAGYGSATPAGLSNSFAIATSAAVIYLSDCAKRYRVFRRQAVGVLSEEQMLLLEKAADSSHLISLLAVIRAKATH